MKVFPRTKLIGSPSAQSRFYIHYSSRQIKVQEDDGSIPLVLPEWKQKLEIFWIGNPYTLDTMGFLNRCKYRLDANVYSRIYF